jgi:hypothetical protein
MGKKIYIYSIRIRNIANQLSCFFAIYSINFSSCSGESEFASFLKYGSYLLIKI